MKLNVYLKDKDSVLFNTNCLNYHLLFNFRLDFISLAHASNIMSDYSFENGIEWESIVTDN